MTRLLTIALLACSYVLTWPGAVSAQMPDKPIRIIVPYAPGGPADVVARLLAQRSAASGGPTVVVENRTGGGQVVGAMAVKQATPDGTTLLMTDLPTFGINATLMPDLPFDPVKDFKPLTTLFAFPSLLVVPASLNVNSVAELVALAKRTQGGIPAGSQGPGSGGQLLAEMFSKATGAPVVIVHYRGSALAYPDLLAGRISMMFGSYPGAKSQIDAGNFKALAVPSKKRIKPLPNVPTLVELGVLDVDLDIWYGLVAPAGTPDQVLRPLRALFVREISSPEVLARLDDQGMYVMTSTPDEFTNLIKKDIARLEPIIKASGAKAN